MTETLLLAFATLALVRAWRFGSLFEKWRAYYEVRGGLLGELLACPSVCLPFHVTALLILLFILPIKIIWASWEEAAWLPLQWLAATGLAQSVWFFQHGDNQ